MKLYSSRFAPLATTWRDLARVAQVVHDKGISAYEAFSPEAFAGIRAADVKILIDHDPKKRAGTVSVLVPHGDWWLADFVLDGPYAAEAERMIERSGKLSPGFDPIEKDPIEAKPISSGHNPTHYFLRAKLNEISVCSPGSIVWYDGAKVTGSMELKPVAAKRHQDTEPSRPVLAKDAPWAMGKRNAGGDLIVDMSDGSQLIYHGAGYRAGMRAPLTSSTVLREIGRRREGRDLVIDRSDGSAVILHGAGYRLAS